MEELAVLEAGTGVDLEVLPAGLLQDPVVSVRLVRLGDVVRAFLPLQSGPAALFALDPQDVIVRVQDVKPSGSAAAGDDPRLRIDADVLAGPVMPDVPGLEYQNIVGTPVVEDRRRAVIVRAGTITGREGFVLWFASPNTKEPVEDRWCESRHEQTKQKETQPASRRARSFARSPTVAVEETHTPEHRLTPTQNPTSSFFIPDSYPFVVVGWWWLPVAPADDDRSSTAAAAARDCSETGVRVCTTTTTTNSNNSNNTGFGRWR